MLQKSIKHLKGIGLGNQHENYFRYASNNRLPMSTQLTFNQRPSERLNACKQSIIQIHAFSLSGCLFGISDVASSSLFRLSDNLSRQDMTINMHIENTARSSKEFLSFHFLTKKTLFTNHTLLVRRDCFTKPWPLSKPLLD